MTFFKFKSCFCYFCIFVENLFHNNLFCRFLYFTSLHNNNNNNNNNNYYYYYYCYYYYLVVPFYDAHVINVLIIIFINHNKL